MRFRTTQRFLRALVVAATAVGTMAAGAAPATAAPPTAVDFTVDESLPLGTPGDLISSDVPGCAAGAATVATPTATRTDSGPIAQFQGTKIFDCGGGNTFTLTFRVASSECSETDSGTWKLVGGTGVFAGAKGHGSLVGTYTLGAGIGTFCDNDGILDHYTGKLKLAP